MNSTNTSFIFWQKWLVIISCAGILVGFLLPFLSTVDFIAANYNQALSETFFGQKTLPKNVFIYNQWVWAMLGAVIIAWSICMLFLALYPFKKHEKWSWWCIASSLLITFIVDIGFSIHFNFYTEIIVSLTWFLGGIIPIIATYKDFFNTSSNDA
jgi:hypothetical protein